MVISFILGWLLIMWIGFLLLPLRSDWQKIKIDVRFAFHKGTLYHKLTIIFSSFIILPISIFYSIRNILNK